MCSHSLLEWLRSVLLFALHRQEKYLIPSPVRLSISRLRRAAGDGPLTPATRMLE